VTERALRSRHNAEHHMIEISEAYRAKALASEAWARSAVDSAIKNAWIEIAIEWHALAARTARESSKIARPLSAL
jgi:hypothetical protein